MIMHGISFFNYIGEGAIGRILRIDKGTKDWPITFKISPRDENFPEIVIYFNSLQQLADFKASVDYALNVARMELS